MSFKTDSPRRLPGYKLALFATAFAVAVVVLGAFTRLVDAGLGCPDWPGCYGHLAWPNDSSEIARAEQLFPDAPVETHKTWPEMVHRYFAGTLGLLIVGLTFLAWKNREEEGYPFRLPILLLFLVVWQALFGMWTVTLKLWPQIVTLHLLGGFTTFALLWLLAVRLDNHRWRVSASALMKIQSIKPWVIGGIVVLVLQILLGGWTTSNYAAFACPDLPACQGQWLPEMDFAEGFNVFQTIGPNYLGGLMESEARVAIHFTHRVGAIVTTIYILGLCSALLRIDAPSIKKVVFLVAGLLALQICLGISNILLMVPLVIAVAHNAVGAFLLLSLVLLATRLWMAQPESGTTPADEEVAA
ncbi:MAG: COX15/CtaA family protein [Pseudomonadales bacterium]|nr:COX15/CtaA family protein [Pseudomonadales bacterium]MCP5172978.1 COX15/CtaA family protein [Pseudomonadales bacterium]MCP5302451.1 COX15/CtaA family protein [Pseudomonadales bacterium]